MDKKEAFAAPGKLVAGRQILFEIYRVLAMSPTSDKFYGIREIGQIAFCPATCWGVVGTLNSPPLEGPRVRHGLSHAGRAHDRFRLGHGCRKAARRGRGQRLARRP